MDDTPIKHGHDPDENPAVSYERSDLDTFAVTKFGIGLAIGTVDRGIRCGRSSSFC